MDRTAAQLQQFLGHPLGDRRVLRLLTKAPEQRYYDQRRPDAGFMGHDMKHFRYLLTALLLSATAQAGSLEWPQLGGPHRDFTSDAKGLANSWPSSGPKKLWSRSPLPNLLPRDISRR